MHYPGHPTVVSMSLGPLRWSNPCQLLLRPVTQVNPLKTQPHFPRRHVCEGYMVRSTDNEACLPTLPLKVPSFYTQLCMQTLKMIMIVFLKEIWSQNPLPSLVDDTTLLIVPPRCQPVLVAAGPGRCLFFGGMGGAARVRADCNPFPCSLVDLPAASSCKSIPFCLPLP